MIMNVESIIQLIYADKLLTKLRKKIETGLGTFKDTTDYCNRSAELLGRLFSENVLTMSDVERITANDTLLKDRYKDINDLLDKVQRTVDKAQGINIRPQHAPFNQERADQIGRSLTDKTVSEETIQRRAGSAPATMTRAMQDDYVEENAKFRSDAGLKTYLVRVTDGDCCEWCTKVAGRYEYGTEPHDIYRRHDNCGCSVTYENGRQRQNVWTKKTWEVPAEDAGAPEPVRLTKEQAAAAGAPPPKVFSKEEAKKLEAEKLKGNKIVLNPDDVNNSSIDKSSESGIIRETSKQKPITEITDKAIESVPKVNISGYTDEQCDIIQKQHKELLEYSRKNNNNNEVAFVFDSSLENRKEYTGSDDIINFGEALSGKNLILLHNHPRNSSYSFNDIVEFFGNGSIKTFTIVKNSGKVETLTKINSYNRLEVLKFLNRINNDIKKKASQKGDFRDSLYRKETEKILNKYQLGGLIEWIK